MSHLESGRILPGQRDQLAGLGHVSGERLLDEDGEAATQELRRDAVVVDRWHDDDGGVHQRQERPEVGEGAGAAAQGDRSENAEYTYGKRRLREIDRRVRFLRRRLEGMVIVSEPPADPRRVFFGAWVDLEDESGARARYRIVGPDEFDMAPGYISMDAPLARALLKRALDDEVTVAAPGGARSYVIVAIEYEAA